MHGSYAGLIKPNRSTGKSPGTTSLGGFGFRRVLVAKPQEKQVISKQAEKPPFLSHIIMRIN